MPLGRAFQVARNRLNDQKKTTHSVSSINCEAKQAMKINNQGYKQKLITTVVVWNGSSDVPARKRRGLPDGVTRRIFS